MNYRIVRNLRPFWRDAETESVQCGPLDSPCSIREKKNYKGQQESIVVVATALFVVPARNNVPRAWSSTASSTRDESKGRRSIDLRAWDRSDITLRRTPAELVDGSSQFPSRETIVSTRLISTNHLFLFAEPLFFSRRRRFLFSSPLPLYRSFLLFLWLWCYFTLALTLNTQYAQFCVLLPPVTLAENNKNICSPPSGQGATMIYPMLCRT